MEIYLSVTSVDLTTMVDAEPSSVIYAGKWVTALRIVGVTTNGIKTKARKMEEMIMETDEERTKVVITVVKWDTLGRTVPKKTKAVDEPLWLELKKRDRIPT